MPRAATSVATRNSNSDFLNLLITRMAGLEMLPWRRSAENPCPSSVSANSSTIRCVLQKMMPSLKP